MHNLLLLGLSLILSLCSLAASAAQVTLLWDASTPTADVAGYEIRYGQTTGANTVMVDAGNVLTRTVLGLANGATYFFRVRAYTVGKSIFSLDSNEVSLTFPPTVITAPVNIRCSPVCVVVP